MTRTIENRIEVPGTPEQVWEAIATGPGIETWFVPAQVEGRVGGRVALDMGGGLEGAGVVTVWSPPQRFAYEEEWAAVEGEPAGRLASEFIVEAQSGGTCVVRIVSTLHAEEHEGWDGVLESLYEGWSVFLLVMRAHFTHFAGERGTTVMAAGTADGPLETAWAAFTGALGLADAAPGDHVTTTGAPALAGTVEHRGDTDLILRLTEPAPGLGIVSAYVWSGGVNTRIHLHLYGDVSDAEAARWREWFAVYTP